LRHVGNHQKIAGDYPHLTAERAEVAEIVKKAFSACFAASAVKENRINAVTFEHVGNHQEERLCLLIRCAIMNYRKQSLRRFRATLTRPTNTHYALDTQPAGRHQHVIEPGRNTGTAPPRHANAHTDPNSVPHSHAYAHTCFHVANDAATQ